MDDEDPRQIMRGNGLGLLEFCDRIGERGDVNATTAKALRSTARTVLSIESADLSSLDMRRLDVDDLLERFGKLKKADYSEGSLETYRSRFRLSVAMYLAWLDDDPNWKTAGRATPRPSKPGNRSRPPAKFRIKPGSAAEPPADDSTVSTDYGMTATAASPGVPRLMTYDVPLRPDLIVRVTLPFDLTTDDAERFANFVRVLAFSGRTASESREEERI